MRQQTSELTGLRQFPRMSVLGREQRDLSVKSRIQFPNEKKKIRMIQAYFICQSWGGVFELDGVQGVVRDGGMCCDLWPAGAVPLGGMPLLGAERRGWPGTAREAASHVWLRKGNQKSKAELAFIVRHMHADM